MRAALTPLLAAVFVLAASSSHAAPPAAPAVTVGADIKEFVFDWDATAGASFYRLLYKVGNGAFKPLIDDIPASSTQVRLSVAVHLQSWSLLRYAIAACNADGCTNSAAVFPQNLMLDTIGYFKASNAGPGDRFGHTVAVSDDGRTLAVSAPQEDSNATGINGNQADNSASNSGAVYVFRRVGNDWRQEAYIKAGVRQAGMRFGSDLATHRRALSLSGNGTLLAVGAAEENLGGLSKAGAVYLYQRSSTGTWQLVTELNAPTPAANDHFGFSIDLSDDGRTLKADGYGPWNSATGKPLFRSEIFQLKDTGWVEMITLRGVIEGDECENTRMSADGKFLAMICSNFPTESPHMGTYVRIDDGWFPGRDLGPVIFQYEGPRVGSAIDYDGSHWAMQATRSQIYSHVDVFQRTFYDASVYSPSLAAQDPAAPKDFGYDVALDRAANLLAVSDISAAEGGAGVTPGSLPGDARVGAVYLWRRALIPNPSVPGLTALYNRAVVRAPNPDEGDQFAKSIALSGTGNALAVGAEGEDSKARGIDGDRTDNSLPDSGAVYLY